MFSFGTERDKAEIRNTLLKEFNTYFSEIILDTFEKGGNYAFYEELLHPYLVGTEIKLQEKKNILKYIANKLKLKK
jgi:hypothetical protein